MKFAWTDLDNASLTNAGDSQSGNPCPKLTLLCLIDSGVNSDHTVGASKPLNLLAVDTDLIDNNDDFNDFLELFKEHPEAEKKLNDINDICIIHNKKIVELMN